MANKQYIFSGVGDPVTNNAITEVPTAHYLDTSSGDIWLAGWGGWKRIYVGGSEGSIASFTGYDAPSEAPTGPSIYTSYGGGNFRMYVAIFKGGEYWAWEEVQLVTNMTP